MGYKPIGFNFEDIPMFAFSNLLVIFNLFTQDLYKHCILPGIQFMLQNKSVESRLRFVSNQQLDSNFQCV